MSEFFVCCLVLGEIDSRQKIKNETKTREITIFTNTNAIECWQNTNFRARKKNLINKLTKTLIYTH